MKMEGQPSSSQDPDKPKIRKRVYVNARVDNNMSSSWKREKEKWGRLAIKDLSSNDDPQEDSKKKVVSNVSHLSYDFTCWPPKRISPIIEEEVDELAAQMEKVNTKCARKKRYLQYVRELRKAKNS